MTSSNHLLALVAALVLAAGCGSWDTVRDEAMNPVNQLLHRKYPKALRARDMDAIAALYAPEAREAGLAADRALLGRFAQVAQGEYVLEKLSAVEDALDDVTADCFVAVRGVDHDGARLTVEQRRRVRVQRGDDGWRIVGTQPLEQRLIHPQGARFGQVGEAWGIAFTANCRQMVDRHGDRWPYASGSGMGVGDVDGDGRDDLLLIATGELRLYINREGGFVDETARRGLRAPDGGLCRFGVFADIDNDGDQDLFVGVTKGDDLLWRNDDGAFVAVELPAVGLAPSGNSTGAVWADFDNDGLLDLYVVAGGNLLHDTPAPVWKAKNAPSNRMFRNQGGWRFEEVTERAGTGDTGWALAVSTADYDRDGDVDVIVANDFGKNVLYRNDGNWRFREVAAEAGVDHHGAHMGCDWGDVDGDGDLDLFVSGMASNSRWVLDYPEFPAPATFPWNVVVRGIVMDIINQMMHGNRLYLNDGDGTFTDVGVPSGVRDADWAWGGQFGDVDNDGRLDLYVPNGFISNPDTFDC